MSELKPCPFCGGVAQVNTWTMHGITESRCFCPNSDCPNSVRTVALATWNTRPLEDALRVQLAAHDALIERLVGAGIEINSCTKVSTFSAEYYTLCKAQREWNEAVTDWEILKGGEE